MTIAFFPRLALASRLALAWGCIAGPIVAAGSLPANAQSIVVMVNGDPITDYDIEQRSKLDLLSTHKQSTRQDEVRVHLQSLLQLLNGGIIISSVV